MTKQLKDILTEFSEQSSHEKLERVKEIRHHRSIERPAVAKRRQDKERKQGVKKVDKTTKLLQSLPPEEREKLIKRLKGEADE